MSLGHHTNSMPKGLEESSMCGKRGTAESVVGRCPARSVRQGESWIASSLVSRRGHRTLEVEHLDPSTAPYLSSSEGRNDSQMVRGNRRGAGYRFTESDKETNGPPTSRYNVQLRRTTGSPKGRESHGDGVPIVLR